MREKRVLSSKKEFDRVYSRGKKAFGKYVVVFCMRNRLKYGRISCVASKKVGNSVKRNRARRLMRESIRLSGVDLRGYDLIVVAKNTINGKKCADVKKNIEAAFIKLNIVNPLKGE